MSVKAAPRLLFLCHPFPACSRDYLSAPLIRSWLLVEETCPLLMLVLMLHELGGLVIEISEWCFLSPIFQALFLCLLMIQVGHVRWIHRVLDGTLADTRYRRYLQ